MDFKEWLKDREPDFFQEGWRDKLRTLYTAPMIAAAMMGGPEQLAQTATGMKAPIVSQDDDAWEQEERRRRQAMQSQAATAQQQAARPSVGSAKMKRRMHRR